MATDREQAARERGRHSEILSARAEILSKPRLFRPEPRMGECLAMRPEAADFSFLWTGIKPNDRTKDNIAIVDINGPLEHHATWMWDSYEAIIERFESALTGQDMVDAEIRSVTAGGWLPLPKDYEPPAPIPASAVVLLTDSPGGEAAGATWCHRKI